MSENEEIEQFQRWYQLTLPSQVLVAEVMGEMAEKIVKYGIPLSVAYCQMKATLLSMEEAEIANMEPEYQEQLQKYTLVYLGKVREQRKILEAAMRNPDPLCHDYHPEVG